MTIIFNEFLITNEFISLILKFVYLYFLLILNFLNFSIIVELIFFSLLLLSHLTVLIEFFMIGLAQIILYRIE